MQFGTVTVRNPSDTLLRLLRITGLDGVLSVESPPHRTARALRRLRPPRERRELPGQRGSGTTSTGQVVDLIARSALGEVWWRWDEGK